ncbi:myosin heavy chain, clone, putative [Perkinsus marinus ATCC 50983]|uniref:Myosin heavy chain, clone, putative n=1 Tax=Perkinsus marinus (strain ATCC 50983 / TXsc) TaxID=423536 RepID=C5L040_PERM5|nr:myosin heavy chain, clone, putative [Perkinsus marinus ATCC 50983]EER09898.1 myosin heavy chain, clone, putative [Perkinsus marinus ATCC 50983]|eukprot:XP_002778103.1 myosin heavy chain, clone, putative [Perkinsus marinus ATCC 50983]
MDGADWSDPVVIRLLLRKVKRYLKKAVRVQRELTNSKEELRAAYADMETMRNDIAYLQEDLDRKLALEKKLLTERDGSKQKEEELMKLVRKMYGTDPAEAYVALLNTNEEMQNEMDAVIEERDDLCQEVEKLQKQVDDFQEQSSLPTPGGDEELLNAGSEEEKQKLEELSRKVERLETENAELRRKVEDWEGRNDGGSSESSRGVIQALAQENVELKRQLRSREVELSGLRADLKEHQKGSVGEDSTEATDRLRQELKELQQQHDELWTHLNKVLLFSAALEDKWDTEEELRALRNQVSQKFTTVAVDPQEAGQDSADPRQVEETIAEPLSESIVGKNDKKIVEAPSTATSSPVTQACHEGTLAARGMGSSVSGEL